MKFFDLFKTGDKTYRSYDAARESIFNTFVTLCSNYVK